MSTPVFLPTIKRKDMDNVLGCLVSDQIGPGAMSADLAKAAALQFNLEGGVVYASYYTALKTTLSVLELQPGDKVILSPLSPALYLDVLTELKLVPLYVDVEPESCILSLEQVEVVLPQGPKAILLHYTLGFIPDIVGLQKFNLPIVEDVSQALGGKQGEAFAGTFGPLAVISLNPDSIITCGCGGLALTKDKNLFRALRKHPATINETLCNMNASLGLIQLKNLDTFIKTREEIAQYYIRSLQNKTRHKTLIQKGEDRLNIHYSFPVIIDTNVKEVSQYALKKGVDTIRAFKGSILGRLEEEGAEGVTELPYPQAQNMLLKCLLFPLYPMLGKKNIELVGKILATLP